MGDRPSDQEDKNNAANYASDFQGDYSQQSADASQANRGINVSADQSNTDMSTSPDQFGDGYSEPRAPQLNLGYPDMSKSPDQFGDGYSPNGYGDAEKLGKQSENAATNLRNNLDADRVVNSSGLESSNIGTIPPKDVDNRINQWAQEARGVSPPKAAEDADKALDRRGGLQAGVDKGGNVRFTRSPTVGETEDWAVGDTRRGIGMSTR